MSPRYTYSIQLQPTTILAMKFLPLLGRRKICRPLKLAVCGRAHITWLSLSVNSDIHVLCGELMYA